MEVPESASGSNPVRSQIAPDGKMTKTNAKMTWKIDFLKTWYFFELNDLEHLKKKVIMPHPARRGGGIPPNWRRHYDVPSNLVVFHHPVGVGWGLSLFFKCSKSFNSKKYHIFKKSIFQVILAFVLVIFASGAIWLFHEMNSGPPENATEIQLLVVEFVLGSWRSSVEMAVW